MLGQAWVRPPRRGLALKGAGAPRGGIIAMTQTLFYFRAGSRAFGMPSHREGYAQKTTLVGIA